MLRKPRGKCLYCNKELNSLGSIYCNNSCRGAYQWKLLKYDVATLGRVSGTRDTCRRVAKRFLLEVYGCKCNICGSIEWRGKSIPLILDHIDGDSDNWELTNLRLVCGNCDMQLPTYKGRNKGSGRHFRRERYRQGKSY